MFATLIAIVLSIYLYFFGPAWHPGGLFPFSVAASAVLLSFGAAALLVSFLPIQKGEQNITPRLSELFRKDWRINFGIGFLFCLPLIIIAVSFLPSPIIPILVLLGAGIDVLYLLIRRIMDYLNPFRVVDFMKNDAFNAIEKDSDGSLCNLIESCSEVAVKSAQRRNSALTNHALDSLEAIAEKFLASSKSLSHPVQNVELKAEGISDSLSYVLLFLFQQLEAIYHESLDKKLEIVAGHVITTLTKIAIYTTRVDLSLTSLPLYYIDKLTMDGMQKGFQDIGIKATSGLLGVADAISKIKDLQYMDLKPSFMKMITTLDAVAKESFKNDKSIKIAVLIHPFKVLNEIIEGDSIKEHQDKKAISIQINQVLEEFATLETVLATMPPIPPLFPE